MTDLKRGEAARENDEVIMTELVLPSHTNALGTIFGGVVMSWIDIAGAICSQRHCRKTVVTASIDDMAFVAAVRLGWIVHIRARVNYTSRTSMEIGVRVDAENPSTGEWHHTASAYLTFVAIDAQGKPSPVPPIIPKTPDEKRRYEEAIKRREVRLARREAKK
jgi:acyl-CoA hydrolase